MALRAASILWLFLCIATCASAQTKQPPEAGPAAKDQERAQQPIQITVVAPEVSAEEKARSENRDERNVSAQESIASFTAMLTAIAAVQIVLAVFAIGYSIRAANAAKVSADVARETLVISQRAFLNVSGFEIRPWGAITPSLSVSVVNTGRLTATITGWACTFSSEPLPSPPDRKALVWHRNAGTVAAGVPATIGTEVPVKWDAETWKQIRSGETRLNVWGVIQYETGFPGTLGETGFGFDYVPTHPDGSYGKRFALADIPGYNYAK
jgi:hypothetical protein